MQRKLQSLSGISALKSVNPLDFLQQHAREIVSNGTIEEKTDSFGRYWEITETAESGELVVSTVRDDINGNRRCNCEWFLQAVKHQVRNVRCEHLYALEIYLEGLLPANFPNDAAHNPNMADCDQDSIKEWQYKMIYALGRGSKQDVESLSLQIYGCWIDQLNASAADSFIAHLKAMQIIPQEVAA